MAATHIRRPGQEWMSPHFTERHPALRFDDSIYPAAKVRLADDRSSPSFRDEHDPAEPRRRLPRWRVAGVAVALIVIVYGGYAISRPVLADLARERVEEALAAWAGPGAGGSVESVSAEIGSGLDVVVDVRGLSLFRDGGLSAEAPHARLRVDPFSGAVTSIDLNEPRLLLPLPDRGAAPAVSGADDLQALIEQAHAQALAALDAAAGGGLTRLTVSGADVRLTDGNALVMGGRLDLLATADAGGRIAIRADLEMAGGGRGYLDYAGDLGEGGTATIGLTDLSPEAVAGFGTVSLERVSGTVSAAFGKRGRLDVVAADLRVDADPASAANVLRFEAAQIGARWNVAERLVTLSPSRFSAGDVAGEVTGEVIAGEEVLTFSLNADTRLGVSDDAPLAAAVALAGSFDPGALTVAIDQFRLASPEGDLTLAASVGFGGATPSLTLDADLAMSVAGIGRIWPSPLAPGARQWFIDHVVEGEVPSAHFRVAAPAGLLFADEPPRSVTSDVLSFNFEFEDTTIRTFGALPPIETASGAASLSGPVFGLGLDDGVARGPGGEDVAVTAGAFAIADVFAPVPQGELEVTLEGSAAALGALADVEPFNALSSQGISPDGLAGTGTVSAWVGLPLDGGGEDRADWTVSAVGKGLASTTPIDGRRISNADITISADPRKLSVAGTAELDGVRAEIAFDKALAVGQGTDRQLARFHLDDIARQQLGLAFEQFVDGVVGAQISSLQDTTGQRFDVDLLDASLTMPGLGWKKPAGKPASLSFDLVAVDGGSSVENIVFEGGGAYVSGSAFIDGSGALASLSFDRFELKPGDLLRMDILPTDNGYSVLAEGAQFDLRGLIAEAKTLNESSAVMPDLSLTVRIDRAVGHNGEVATGFDLEMESSGGDLLKTELNGAVGGAPVAFALTHGGNRWQVNAADAGGLLRFLDVETRIAGGALAVAAAREGSHAAYQGSLQAGPFRILEESEVITAIARAPGPRNGNGGGISVEHMSGGFSLFADVITIDEAFLRGQTLGATFKGVVDLAGERLNIGGTYLPLYGVNNMFGRVPVVGRLLGGKQEGLIGVTFRVEGPLDDPGVRINPLSAVAPGILRKIFVVR